MDHSLITPLTAPLYAISGLLVGMTGIGGGSLMTPLLVFVFGFDPKIETGPGFLAAGDRLKIRVVGRGLIA